jgi:malate dehydrogenase (oxaloacetate-decarboxylating)
VLGLGDIGAAGALPVMEGKALLFKEFAGVDAVPICLDVTELDELVETIARLAPAFGGINLEGHQRPALLRGRAPAAGRLDIPSSTTTSTARASSCSPPCATPPSSPVGLGDLRVVVSGAGRGRHRRLADGARGRLSATSHRRQQGHGPRRARGPQRREAAVRRDQQPQRPTGSFVEALEGADVLVGPVVRDRSAEAVRSMNRDSIVFAMANPDPEVHPDVAHACGARRRRPPGAATTRTRSTTSWPSPAVLPRRHSTAGPPGSPRHEARASEAARGRYVGDEPGGRHGIPSPFEPPRSAPAVATGGRERPRATRA